MVDDPLDIIRIVRPVKRLKGQAEIVAYDLGGGAVDPGNLGARAAPG